MIAEVLPDTDYHVTTCTRPDDAVEQAARSPFAVAVVDLVMPGLDGIELAGRIRQQSPDTQVILLTGHGDLESAIASIQHGITDYLQKERIDIKRLLRSVGDAAQRARLLRENRSLLAQLQEGNRRLRLLHDTADQISGEAHLDRLLSGLVASATALCGAERGRAILFDPTPGDRLVVEQAVGDAAGTLPGMRFTPGEGIAARAALTDVAILAREPRKDREFSDRIDALPASGSGLVCAPLRRSRVRGVLMVAGSKQGGFTEADRDGLAILARHAAVAIENAIQHEQGINFFTHTSSLLISLLDRVDVHYSGHSREAARLCDMITRRLGLGDDERRNVHFAALLHDIGKLLLPPGLLASTVASEADREVIKSHPTLALDLLKPIAAWEEILPMIYAHHERWDGRGYPLGTAGEAIPLGARIIAVAEAFDAMTRERPHGPKRSPEAALVELEKFAGTQFDPKIVRLFVAEYRQG
jgi:response regulator RpfG family c-di-GMP phosphodiesterase